MANHPRTYKTSKELILPREIRYTTSKEIGVIEKKRPKLKHLLGLEHRNIPIQLDLWGNEAIFRRKGQTTQYGYPRYET
jgi:hypothetical protein